MKKSCLYFDKKYKCASFIDHYKGLTLIRFTGHVVSAIMLALEKAYKPVKKQLVYLSIHCPTSKYLALNTRENTAEKYLKVLY